MTPAERTEFTSAIIAALKDDNHMLTDDERRWVKLAIEKEAQSIKLRQAIISHSLTMLMWSALAFLVSLIVKGLESHGYKP